MKVNVIGERVILLLDLSREEYVCFQVPFAAEEATQLQQQDLKKPLLRH
jgi:hypothetical protein